MTRQMLMDNVYLTHVPSEKFKTSFFSAQMAAPLRPDTAGLNALLVNVLSRGTARLPDMTALGRELDMLYGARLGPQLRRMGENQVFGFTASCVDDRFLPPGEELLEKTADLMGDMFCAPALQDGRLRADYADSERANLIDEIRSIVNDKRVYAARRLLETEDPMAVVDGILIPALDRVGADFEAGKGFLPQLIQAAGAAQAAFEVIREQLSARPGGESAPKAPIVLATVKGDIHDIGKNIVKVLLENYGYPVIDLGKDVEPAAVVEAAKRHAAPLVGLSALMTTTLGSMEETIRLLRAEQVACKVVVGGAVLTADYAKKIGADFYAKDAKESVDVARQVIG